MNEKLEQKVNLYTNIVFFVVIVLFVGLRICGYYNLFAFMGKYASYYLSLITQVGLIFLLPVFLLKTLSKSRTKEVFQFSCYKKTSFKVLFAAVLLGIIVFFINVYVANFFNNIIGIFGYKHASSSSDVPATWLSFFVELFCTALLPAVCEETLNRGIFLNGHSMFGMRKSVLLSGLMFGLLHMNIEQFFYATLIGFLLGYLCWWCGSIYPGMIVHFMNNALSVFFSFSARRGWGIGGVFDKIAEFVSHNGTLGFVIFCLFMAFLVIVGYLLIRQMQAETVKRQFSRRKNDFAKFALREAFLMDVARLNEQTTAEESKDMVLPANEEDFMRFVEKNIDNIVKNAAKSEVFTHKFKMDKKAKILLIASIVLSAAMTILTFVWGLL